MTMKAYMRKRVGMCSGIQFMKMGYKGRRGMVGGGRGRDGGRGRGWWRVEGGKRVSEYVS